MTSTAASIVHAWLVPLVASKATSSPLPGTVPQLQFAAVLHNPVPTGDPLHFHVQVAAYAVLDRRRTIPIASATRRPR
ncbi:MAG: hypothetical protein ACJ8F1_19930 [Polyangia bacterium]